MFILIFLFLVQKDAMIILDPYASHSLKVLCAILFNMIPTPSLCDPSSSFPQQIKSSPERNRFCPDCLQWVLLIPTICRQYRCISLMTCAVFFSLIHDPNVPRANLETPGRWWRDLLSSVLSGSAVEIYVFFTRNNSIISQDMRVVSAYPCFCNRCGFTGGVVSPCFQPSTGRSGCLCFRRHYLHQRLVTLYDTLASRLPYSSNCQGLHNRPLGCTCLKFVV